MDARDHVTGVGNIVTNLQALESKVLRGFLVERYGQCADFPKMGDKVGCRNYLTNFLSTERTPSRITIAASEEHERQQYSIDASVVLIRDALAHGRLYARGNDPAPPFELWKFGRANGEGKMPVEFS